MLDNIKKSIFIIFVSWILAFILLILAYMLPVDPMYRHAKESLLTFEEEGKSPTLIAGFKSTYLDTYTDMTMLNMAIYDGKESLTNRAMKNFRYEYEGEDVFDSGIKYLQGDEGVQAVPYARYWHGWIVLLKPLLLVMNYSEIRMFNFIVQSALLVLLLWKLLQNSKTKLYIVPFFAALMVIMPLSTAMSMGLSILMYVILMSMILFLHYYDWLYDKKLILQFFVLVGVITSFVDLVTYPLATLGLLLVTWILLKQNYKEETAWKTVKEAVGLVIGWCAGYLGMWLGKWVIGSIITDENVLKDAILMVLYRASYGSAESGTYIELHLRDVLIENLGVLYNPIYITLFVFAVFAIFWNVYKYDEKLYISKCQLVLLFLIGCSPFVWYICIGNHSYIHYWMAYKSLSITVFAWGSLLVNFAFEVKKHWIK